MVMEKLGLGGEEAVLFQAPHNEEYNAMKPCTDDKLFLVRQFLSHFFISDREKKKKNPFNRNWSFLEIMGRFHRLK